MSHRQLFWAAAICLAGGVGTAQARDADVQWSVTIGTPVYAQPIVQYAQPVVRYVQPVPVYRRLLPVYVQPVQVYQPQDHGPAPRWQASRWDRDGDGIPNRHDRLYNPRWDRDGDGIPNRRDAYDNGQRDNSWRGEFRGGAGHRADRHAGQGRYGD